ncbi:hypothetical protein [Nocardioides mesophilus]|uniref:Uncharacterized protein n=1 Tax=Nocardioides mesophilus TaxID=433659 RepID=A0A7G9R847_9ACTN|nr:hypothetical protein [Nocardioides mesophilus]QNN51772.1 hypothetical protein H9L09_14620 [Nocardioides mesophilus]
MLTNLMTQAVQPNAGLALPVVDRDRAASVRALPLMSGVAFAAAFAGTVDEQGTAVCTYAHIAAVAVAVKGAFPGTSAWSPPI